MNQKDLEEALVTNVTRFLLELGKGFAYVGRQMGMSGGTDTEQLPYSSKSPFFNSSSWNLSALYVLLSR